MMFPPNYNTVKESVSPFFVITIIMITIKLFLAAVACQFKKPFAVRGKAKSFVLYLVSLLVTKALSFLTSV